MAGSGVDGLGNAVLNLASTIRDLGSNYYTSNAAWEEFPLQVELLQEQHNKVASQLERYGQDAGPVLKEVEKLMLNEVKILEKRRDREEASCCESLCGIKFLGTRRMAEIEFPKSIGYAIADVMRAYDGIEDQLSDQQELEESLRLGATLQFRASLSLDASFWNPGAMPIGPSPDRSKKTAIEPITLQLALESTWAEELHESASQVFLEFLCNDLLCHHHLSRLLQDPAWVMSTLKFLENTSLLDKPFWETNTIQGVFPQFESILADTEHPEFQIQAAQTLGALVSQKVNWEDILGTTSVLHQLVNLLSQVQNAEVQCSAANFFISCSYSHNDSNSLRKLVLFRPLLPALVKVLGNDRNALLQRQAALALQNFACAADTLTRRRILDSPMLLETLVASLTKRQDPDLQWDAAWAIANLAGGSVKEGTREQIANFPKLLDNLESCLDQDANPNLQVHAARALIKLAATTDTLKLLQILAKALDGKQDPLLQEGAAAGLSDLARCDDANREQIVNFPGLLGNLVISLEDDLNSGLQPQAAKALLNLASTSDNSINLKIASFPLMLGSLVDALGKRQNPGLQCNAAWAIANLAGSGADQATKNQIANFFGLLHHLEISLDQEDNPNLRVRAASALINLAKAKDIAKLLPVIAVSLEGIQDPSIREEAAGLVEDLAREGDAVRDQILSSPGLLDNLVKSLLDDVNCALQAQAARALIVLTWTEDVAKLRILSSPLLLESLVASVRKRHNPDLQFYAAWVIANLAGPDADKKARNEMITNFPGLLENLEISLDQDDNPNLRLRAARALINLAWTKDTPKLLQILVVSLEGKQDPVLQEAAVVGVADLARGDDVIEEQVLKFPGLLENLVQSLEDDVSCGLQTQAARALVNLTCSSKDNVKLILSFPPLLGTLKASIRKCGNHTLQSYAAWAIANLAGAEADKVRREQIASFPGLVDDLETSLDQEDNPNLRVRAAKSLLNLDWTKDTSKLLQIFAAFLQGKQDAVLQEGAACGVADLARGEDVSKEQIVGFPMLLENLVKALDEDMNSGVQTEAGRALVSLACAKKCSVKVTLTDPLVLGSLVASLGRCSNPDLQSYAAWTIANLAGAGEDQEVTRKTLTDFPELLSSLEASLDRDENPNLQVRAGKALMNLAWTQDTPKLLQKLAMSFEKKQDPSLQERAASGLSDLALGDEKVKEQIVNFPGMLENFVQALDDDLNSGIQTQVARSLLNLACATDTSVKARILSFPSLLGSLVASLRKAQTPLLQSYAAWAIANLAGAGNEKEQIANCPGLLDNLETSLDQDDNPSLRVRAARALVNLAWTKDSPKLLRMLAVTLEGEQDPLLRQAAAASLGDLARVDDPNRDRMVSFPGLVENLIDALGEDVNRDLQTEAANALVSLTNTEVLAIKVRMLSCPLLLESLVASFGKDQNPGIELSGMMAVANFASEGADQAIRENIANFPGVIDYFENSLDREDPQIRVVSAVGLVNLEWTEDTPRLLAVLAESLEGKEDVFLQSAAAEGLANLGRKKDDDVAKDQILCFPGVVENLVKALDDDVNADLQEQAARCLLNLASSRDTSIKVKVLHFPELLKGLVGSLRKCKNLGLQWRAAGAIGNLAGEGSDDETREEIANFPGLLENLESCLDQDDNPNLRVRAARALLNLAWTKDTPKLLRTLAVPLEGNQDPSLQEAAAIGLAEAKIASLQLRN